jgi:hypothetical protein
MQLDGSFKVFGSRFGLSQIVPHIPAIHVARSHRGIALQRFGKIGQRLIFVAQRVVRVSRDQPQVLVLGQDRLVLVKSQRIFLY